MKESNLILDYNKIKKYDEMFQGWKKELFPNEDYKYLNECCASFRDVLSEKALEEGFDPNYIICFDSKISDGFFNTYKDKGLTRDTEVLYVEITTEIDDAKKYHLWGMYHMAMLIELPIYKNSDKKENIVFDPCLFKSPITEKQWRDNINALDERTEVSSYQNIKNQVIEDFGKDMNLEIAKASINKMEYGEKIVLKNSLLVDQAIKQENIEIAMRESLRKNLRK